MKSETHITKELTDTDVENMKQKNEYVTIENRMWQCEQFLCVCEHMTTTTEQKNLTIVKLNQKPWKCVKFDKNQTSIVAFNNFAPIHKLNLRMESQTPKEATTEQRDRTWTAHIKRRKPLTTQESTLIHRIIRSGALKAKFYFCIGRFNIAKEIIVPMK